MNINGKMKGKGSNGLPEIESPITTIFIQPMKRSPFFLDPSIRPSQPNSESWVQIIRINKDQYFFFFL